MIRDLRPGVPRVLAVAGSDPSGGAGIQADVKSICAAGGYAMAVPTALTVQSTQGVGQVHVPPPDLLSAQLEALAEDIVIDAVKIGMIGTAENAERLGVWLDGLAGSGPPVVLDPVLVSTSGARLLAEAPTAFDGLLERAHVVTPNVPELAELLGAPAAQGWGEVVEQAQVLAARYDTLVVAKGGHLAGRVTPDALVAAEGVVVEVRADTVETTSTHGTGCALSSGLATRYARTGDWGDALVHTKRWLTAAIAAGETLGVGRGAGPVDHFAEHRDRLR